MLYMFSKYTTDPQQKSKLNRLSTTEGAAEYEEFTQQRPNLLEVLDMFPSCNPPLFQLLDMLSPNKPRYFSISSSRLVTPSKISLTVGIVKNQIARTRFPQRPLTGLFSQMLLNHMNGNTYVKVFFEIKNCCVYISEWYKRFSIKKYEECLSCTHFCRHVYKT